ncbi:MAG: iron-containing alcohol dehydrogenase [Halioglobus sp.]
MKSRASLAVVAQGALANINLPRILRVGAGASGELAQTLTELGASSPLLITDPFMVECGYCRQIEEQLDAAAVSYGLFSECVPDPTTDSIASAMTLLRAGNYDSVVALGGGSSLDTAKAIAVLATHGGQMRDYKVPATVDSGLPIIAIPTTAGTGSEATRVAVITDTQTQEKMLCMGLGLMPVAALVDFELTLTMPYRLTADTGIDSLCHALEAYVSRKANPFTDGIALTAMRTIYLNIRIACAEPDNRQARQAMMLAATQGGIAFANASVTLIHGMSRPIGALFHVPHGLSNAMLLPAVTAWSVSGNVQRYGHCARYMEIATEADSDEEACEKLVAALRALTEDLRVPGPREYGITQQAWSDAIALMATQALDSGSPANNPRLPEHHEIADLYRSLW